MNIVNTSFHIYHLILNDFLRWIREEYAPAARKAGLGSIQLAKIDFEPDPETISFAFSASAPSADTLREWHDGVAAELRETLTSRYGERVLYFTTYMEVIDL